MSTSSHKLSLIGTLGLLMLVASCSDSADPLTDRDTVEIKIEQITDTAGILPGTESTESDVAIGTRRQTNQPTNDTNDQSSDAADTELERESVEIKPYNGPPIYLNEPLVPPPATIVTERQPHKTNYPDGTLHIERQITRYSDDRIENDGTYREYFPNEQVFVEGEYVKGEQQGKWIYWHDNGQQCRVVNYQNGLPDGSWEVFRVDGTLEGKRSFKIGKRDGEWTNYESTGKQQLNFYNYQNGQPHGVWNEWFPSGQQKRAMQFKNGQREGKAIEWNETGNKKAEANYKDGKFHGTIVQWSADGEKFIQEFDQGRLVKKQDE
jgi:antitoxin component YwqK of YwqJK toxin-antitoxin module